MDNNVINLEITTISAKQCAATPVNTNTSMAATPNQENATNKTIN
jgi:hypothetical protein